MPFEIENIRVVMNGLKVPGLPGINLLETGTRGTSRAQDPDSGIPGTLNLKSLGRADRGSDRRSDTPTPQESPGSHPPGPLTVSFSKCEGVPQQETVTGKSISYQNWTVRRMALRVTADRRVCSLTIPCSLGLSDMQYCSNDRRPKPV